MLRIAGLSSLIDSKKSFLVAFNNHAYIAVVMPMRAMHVAIQQESTKHTIKEMQREDNTSLLAAQAFQAGLREPRLTRNKRIAPCVVSR